MGRRFRCRAIVAVVLGIAASAHAAPAAGDAAPDALGRTAQNEPVSIAAYAGKVVVLSFWASWCGPCRKELPILEGIQQVVGPERVQVVAVNIEDRDTFRKLAPKLTSLRMLVASDASGQAQRAYGVQGIPHMVIVDKAGKVLRVHRGYSEAGVDDVVDDLNRALAQ